MVFFFNDCAFGIASPPTELLAYAHRLGIAAPDEVQAPIHILEQSGYVRIAVGEAVAILDCAPIGPDHLPAHAHADTLSFELSLAGQRVVVNSGTSEYGTGAERQRQRGTAAHSTVVVDGEDSSEVWAGFRVARRARPGPIVLESGPSTASVKCSHDGYRRLRGGCTHARSWEFGSSSVMIVDNVSGTCARADARLFLHPDVQPAMAGPSEVLLRLGREGTISVQISGAEAVEIQRSFWHPRFGERIATHCICARFDGSSLRTLMVW